MRLFQKLLVRSFRRGQQNQSGKAPLRANPIGQFTEAGAGSSTKAATAVPRSRDTDGREGL